MAEPTQPTSTPPPQTATAPSPKAPEAPVPSATAQSQAQSQPVSVATPPVPGPAPVAAPQPAAAPAPAPVVAAAAPPPPVQAPPADNMTYRPLNVRDALSYLDQVKVQFHDRPDVYNRFLDVMKEFKGQIIDTPGVIDRVSTLFRGHPSLIQGFNTFLPPGYRIECSTSVTGDATEGLITVITPTGVISQMPGGGGWDNAPPPSALAASAALAGNVPTSATASVEAQQAKDEKDSKQDVKSAIVSTSTPVRPLNAQPPPSAAPAAQAGAVPGQNVEFNHAISYVNKIKNRFGDEPDTYKQFLEILQTYQRDGRAIQDVYAQVTLLFKSAPDLLDEFKQFLPDTTSSASTPATALGFGSLLGAGSTIQHGGHQQDKKIGSGGLQASRTGSKKDDLKSTKRKPSAQQPVATNMPVAEVRGGAGSRPKKSKHYHSSTIQKMEASPPPGSVHGSHHGGSTVLGGSNRAGVGLYNADEYNADVAREREAQNLPISNIPQAYVPATPLATPSEIAFFERVKKFIEDRETYHEFLKLLNLFVQDIIDSKMLLERAYLFIGEAGQLWAEFRALLGDEGASAFGGGTKTSGFEGGMVENTLAALDRPKFVLAECKSYGPSYRKLPKTEVNLACTGRDPMCWEVLNDEWVSHASGPAEESTVFIAHKKNYYEECLHRSEEERHEYDYHIEANLRTIALLEPLAQRIQGMNAEERAVFRLKPGLGGQSKSIYQRIIKKIYGKEAGLEVIAALHDNPAVAVPVVLSRLKQKDDEWKRAQREWNKVWREVDAKNFYKSLDHQGVTFKVNDKKATSTKSLIGEIEALKREQNVRREASGIDGQKARYQYAFEIKDVGVLQDSLRLIFSYLDRVQGGGFNQADRERVEMFLKGLVPEFFCFDKTEFEAALASIETSIGYTAGGMGVGGDDDDVTDAGSDFTAGDEGENFNGGFNGKKSSAVAGTSGAATVDLRKQLLKSGIGGPALTSSERASSVASSVGAIDAMAVDEIESPSPLLPEGSSAEAAAVANESVAMVVDPPTPPEDNGKGWLNVPDGTGAGTESASRATSPGVSSNGESKKASRKNNFFANSSMYCLFRLLHMLYNRVNILKSLAKDAASVASPSVLTNPLAVELGLTEGAGLDPKLTEKENPAEAFYEFFMAYCEKLFEGEIDQATFEENMRHMYGTKAYISFTLDKLIASIIKQAQTVITDAKSTELLGLLRQDRKLDVTTTRQQIAYRMAAEAVLGPEEIIYRLEWIKSTQTMLIQQMGKDDVSVDDAVNADQKWKAYAASYVLSHPTEGLKRRVTQPFLKRSVHPLPSDADPNTTFDTEANLELKFASGTLKAFFVPETEDFFNYKMTEKESEEIAERLKTVQEEKKVKLDKWLEEKSTATTSGNTAPPS